MLVSRLSEIAGFVLLLGVSQNLLSAAAIKYEVVQCAAPLNIDGKLEENFWNSIPEERLIPTETAVPSDLGGSIRLALRGNELCIAVQCPEPASKVLARSFGRNPVWEKNSLFAPEVEDRVELHIDGLRIGINPWGAVRIEQNGTTHPDLDVKSATGVDSTGWTVEAVIPLALLDEAVDARFRFQRIRSRRPLHPEFRWSWPVPGSDAELKLPSATSIAAHPTPTGYDPPVIGNSEPAIEIGRISRVPSLEADWDAPAWKNLSAVRLPRNEAYPRAPRQGTEVKWVHDRQTLALLFRAHEPEPLVANHGGRDSAVIRDRILISRYRAPRGGEPEEVSTLPVVGEPDFYGPARYRRAILTDRDPTQLSPLESLLEQVVEDGLSGELARLDSRVWSSAYRRYHQIRRMVNRHSQRRIERAVWKERTERSRVETRQDWEQFRGVRLQALQEAVGRFPPKRPLLEVRYTSRYQGDGYRLHNLVYQSRPGFWVTANLYLPIGARPPLPAIVIHHSHHYPRTQGELQDMGMLWARAGCAVLVTERLGFGERVETTPWYRQAYASRFTFEKQLGLIGETHIGWLAWDLIRAIDLLYERPDIDRNRIILIGAVASGGQAAALAAALDPRISAVVPFNYDQGHIDMGEDLMGKISKRRRPESELLCITPEVSAELSRRQLHQLARDTALDQLSDARARRESLNRADRLSLLQEELAPLLGDIEPDRSPRAKGLWERSVSGAVVEGIVLEVEEGIRVPLLLIRPAQGGRVPVVIGVAQGGKDRFLRNRSDDLERLIQAEMAICLPDVRGTGETAPDVDRSDFGAQRRLASREFSLGNTLLGARLKDLRTVIHYLRTRADIDPRRMSLWGDAFVPTNPQPLFLDELQFQSGPQIQHQAEPLGAHLALLAALYEASIHTVAVRGGLVGYLSVLESPFPYVPMDVMVPGILKVADIPDITSAIASRPLLTRDFVNGRNQIAARQPGAPGKPDLITFLISHRN